METSRQKVIYWVIASAIVVCVAMLAFLPRGQQRKYPGRTPVYFWHTWTGQWKDVIDNQCERFNRSQNKYEVIPLSLPSSTAEYKFLLAITGGNPPDCISYNNYSIPKWAESGLLEPLNKVMTPAEYVRYVKEINPVGLKVGSYKKHLYGACGWVDLIACYYRVDHLRQAGLDPNHLPQTMEELVRWGKKLDKYDNKGKLVRLGFLPRDYFQLTYLFGNGFFDWDKQQLLIDTPDNLRCLVFYRNIWNEHGFSRVVRFNSGLDTGSGGGVQWPFISGSYSIDISAQYRVSQLAEYAPDIKYVTSPVPPPAGGRKACGWCTANVMMIPKGAVHSKGAWEFIKFWTGFEHPEKAAEFYVQGGWIPAFPAVSEAPAYREYVKKYPQFKTFLNIMDKWDVEPSPPVTYQNYLLDELYRAQDLVQRGNATPAQALSHLDKEMAEQKEKLKEFHIED